MRYIHPRGSGVQSGYQNSQRGREFSWGGQKLPERKYQHERYTKTNKKVKTGRATNGADNLIPTIYNHVH